jgi:hypothetical protein
VAARELRAALQAGRLEDGAHGFALVSEAMDRNVQAATGARDPGGVVYTPALQPYSEARDQAWLLPDCY